MYKHYQKIGTRFIIAYNKNDIKKSYIFEISIDKKIKVFSYNNLSIKIDDNPQVFGDILPKINDIVKTF
jgi:hypothetical protein